MAATRPRLARKARPASEPVAQQLKIAPPAQTGQRAKALKVDSSSEPEAIAKARTRLRTIVNRLSSGRSPRAVHLVLAICNQETGNHRAANAIIEEMQLDKRFGIKKFDFEKDET